MQQKFYSRSQVDQKPNLENLYNQTGISKTEKAFLDGLEIKLGQKIIRQASFGKWLLDGLLANRNIVIEYDGPENHQDQKKQDKDWRRDKELLAKGFIVYRLQWFDFIKDYNLYQKALRNCIEFSAKDINILIQLSKFKYGNH